MTRLGRWALALLASLAIAVLLLVCWWASADPDSALYVVLSMVLAFAGVMVAGSFALLPVVARQANRGPVRR